MTADHFKMIHCHFLLKITLDHKAELTLENDPGFFENTKGSILNLKMIYLKQSFYSLYLNAQNLTNNSPLLFLSLFKTFIRTF